MISIDAFRQAALSFPGTSEQPHLEKTSFMVNRKIFATLNIGDKEAVLKLSAIDQSVFCSTDRTVICPVKGAWGKQGWTTINLESIKKTILMDSLACAYCAVAPKKLSDNLKKGEG